ncbi:DNA-formamidopyrimidine glycosylase [Cohnella sp. CIP 111063]|uniref:DNA-formamidopyrimidine glycosylase n=1 Tax=unclassified Cohnella TaxID=2636738 RepID=UPI000B8BC030|nr:MULTISPECIES: DNA-formamidopyrimidine glycosylase [unclassified Cohnella]OXS62750.1 DNA-formamidopyrimidine glycosylase [Cohnella sp. CIP 111063]PRX75026.1 DNA-(apurinic or apyrimidinic site) lyase [Cohnella sp. SGD-V74]
MPELPEVETVRRTLNQLIAGKTIELVTVSLPRILQKPDDPQAFAAMLEGRTFQSVERRGKFLRLVLDGLVLISHLRMEGRYGLYGKDDPVELHTHVRFSFTDGTELRYKDVRQFGTMHLFAPGDEWTAAPLNKLGLEPLDESFTLDEFRRALVRRTTKIKPLLLNQEIVVGLGNIYVDEALHAAGIHPETPASELKRKEQEKLHGAIVATLSAAVDAGGSSIKSYVNGQGEMGMFQFSLRAYGRTGEPCPECGTPIEKSVVGGRGTHVCPKCQKPPRGGKSPTSTDDAAPASKRPRTHAVKRRLDGAER